MALLSWEAIERGLGARSPERLADSNLARAAVALILRDGERGIELLFIRRAEDPRDPWSGQMAFPGGRAEPDDLDLSVTTIRETVEEIGVDLAESARFLGALDEVRAMARLRPMNLTITPFVFRLLRPAAEFRLSHEVRSAHFIPVDDLVAQQSRSTFEYVHEGTTLTFPCLRIPDRLAMVKAPPTSITEVEDLPTPDAAHFLIWGLTYRMFMSFGALFPDVWVGGEPAVNRIL